MPDPDDAPASAHLTDPTLTAIRGDGPPTSAATTPAAGDERYEVGEEVARGGGGRILRAYDRVLHRTVALKEPLPSDPRGERLVREAMVMAGLEHPSIVPVHDLGKWDSGVPFYAMKLLGGRTLRDVIREAAGFEERIVLLPVVVAIAEAVAYAHAREVVHRDLKPANVIIGEFGETSVIDWGLARRVGAEDGVRRVDEAPGSASVTRSDAVVGTPAYMPPEQATGDPISPRADVYSLGALLYHVLAGSPPYRGADSAAVIGALLVGPPPAITELEPRVPADLAAIVAKAMARDPAARYPSARELADDLRRYQTGRLVAAHRYSPMARARRWLRRHRGAAVSGLAVLTAAGALLMLVRGGGPDPDATCARAGGRADGVWNPTRAEIGRAAVLGTDAPHAAPTWAGLDRMLDNWTGRWKAARVQTCRATHVRGEQSAEALDLRMSCLDRRLDALAATVGLLDAATAAELDRLLGAAAALPSLESCDDVAALRAAVPRPEDPAARARLELAEKRLAEGGASNLAGRFDEAGARAAEVLAEARALDWAPLVAGAELLAGEVAKARGRFDESDAALARAELLGDRGRDDRVRAAALLMRVALRAEQERTEDVGPLLERAAAAVARTGDPALHVDLLDRQATVAAAAGDYDEAVDRGREALALHRELRADDLDREARLVGRLGSVEMRRERLDAAEALIREAAAVFERLYGEAHPTIAVGLMNLGGIELQRNEPAKAVVLLERALATLERFHGPDHPNVLGALNNLATTLTSLERYAEARTHLERGLARADEGGQRGELYGALLYNLGQNAHYSNDLPSAERWYQRAIDFHAESHGADHPRTAGARYALGSVLLAAARPREAAAALAAALPVHEQHPGHGGWDLAYTRADLGRAHTDLGDHRRALPLLEAALPPLAETGDTLQVGLTTFALARALWATGQRRRALGHAAATAAMWTDPQFAAELAKLTTWRHGKQP